MKYTLAPSDLRRFAEEIKADLANTYDHLREPETISPAELRYWEKRRAALLHQHGRALCFADDLERLNALHADKTNKELFVGVFREAAE